MPSDSALARLPAELIVLIFQALPSFSDIALFAATCRRHRQIWVNHAYTFYQQVAPRTIPCHKHARVFLADQGGAPTSATNLSFQDVLQLIRNAATIERSVADFEKHHIRDVREYDGAKRRLPYLTRTERVRFIRCLYQMWGLLLQDPEMRQQRIRSLKLKDQTVAVHLIRLWIVYIPDPTILAMENGDDPEVFAQVVHELYEHLEQLVPELFHEEFHHWWWPPSEGLKGCVCVWDSYYTEFKDTILKGSRREKPYPVPEMLWDDTSDDEYIEQ